ncbi:hypothetical protein Tco_1113572 [Tanacetum coccineum]|uniref:Reverse transcriptase domain-containing protein n=1 Tax=Tanacetum coccineum TaxID=301880 RepID=A0ABQ5ISN9_9ASTR
MVYFVDGVLASGVEIILEMDFVRYAIQELEIHSFMIQIRTLSMILQTFSTILHNPSVSHTRVSYVGTILAMVLIVRHGYRLSMSRNRATIKLWNQNFYEPNLCYNSYSSGFEQPTQTSIDHQPPKEMTTVSTHTPEPSRRFNFIYDDDDDDDDDNGEESTIPLNEITSQIPPSIAITLVLPIMELQDSLNIGDEHLSTIPEKESDKVINDDESLPEEDVLKENFKIYSNPLFEFDDEYISSDVNPLFNEVLEDIESEESYVSKLDEPDLLVTPLSKLNENECFDLGGDFVLEEIKACPTSDSIPLGIDDPEGDILLLEKLLNDDPSSPLPPKELNFEELKVIKSDVSTDFEDDYYDSEGDIIYLESFA